MLTAEEKELQQEWEECGVLGPLKPKIIPLSEQAVVASCFDKRFFSGWYRQMSRMAARRQNRKDPELFPIICAGAPLVVAPSSPIHSVLDHRPMFESSVGLAYEHGCRHAAILGHYPCLAGVRSKISLLHNVALLVAGKKWWVSKGLKTVLLFDLNGEGDMLPNVRHLKANEFEVWCQNRRPGFVRQFPEVFCA